MRQVQQQSITTMAGVDTSVNKGYGNLIPTTLRSKEEARRISSKGGIRSGEVRRQKKQQREYILEILQGKIKDIPLTAEKLAELCKENGLKPNAIVGRQHAAVIVSKALAGNYNYSKTTLEADGSDQPQAIDISMGGVTINLTASKEAKEAKEIWEGDIEDLDE